MHALATRVDFYKGTFLDTLYKAAIILITPHVLNKPLGVIKPPPRMHGKRISLT